MYTLFIIGRILLGGFFIYNGVNHFLQLDMMTGYAKSKHLPFPKYAIMLTGLALLLGGLSIVFGVYMHVGMVILIVFLLGTLVTMHTFWKVSDPHAKAMDRIQFMKNLALIGALLMMVA